MTIQGMIDFCKENNYQEISLPEHIRKYYGADMDYSRLCTVTNKFHDLMIQCILNINNDAYIDEIYIDYEEDKENPTIIVLQATEQSENLLEYRELRNLDDDMNWI